MLNIMPIGSAVFVATVPGDSDMNLVMVCLSAFLAVCALLSILSLLIKLLTVLFPGFAVEPEPAVAKAIEEAVGKTIPGGRIVRIEARNPKAK